MRVALAAVDSTNAEAARPRTIRPRTDLDPRRGTDWRARSAGAALVQPAREFLRHSGAAPDRTAGGRGAALLCGGAGVARCLRGADRAADRVFTLKWPNDVLLNGGKLAGILLESIGQGGRMATSRDRHRRQPDRGTRRGSRWKPGAVRPVSLLAETGSADDARGVSLTPWPRPMRAGRPPSRPRASRRFATAWLAHAARLGEPIRARTGRDDPRGRVRDHRRNRHADPAHGRRHRLPSRRPKCFSEPVHGGSAMLLAIDCGNTNTVFSIWDGDAVPRDLAHRHRSQAHGG